MPADELARFRVIRGDGRKKRYAKADPQDIEQIVCKTCEIDIGVATSSYIQVTVAPMEKKGKPFGGTKRLACTHCLARGKVTYAL